jgi:hypothetical protein
MSKEACFQPPQIARGSIRASDGNSRLLPVLVIAVFATFFPGLMNLAFCKINIQLIP